PRRLVSGERLGGTSLKRTAWSLSEALEPRLAQALKREPERLLQSLMRSTTGVVHTTGRCG
ncbi:hypothetical protein BHE74_00051602, partial [Ensete ventricosum]